MAVRRCSHYEEQMSRVLMVDIVEVRTNYIPTHDLFIRVESLLTALMHAGRKISTNTERDYHQADVTCFCIVLFAV